MKLTFLKKVKRSQQLTKLYGLGEDGEVCKKSDYDAGMFFRHESVEVANLGELRECLIRFGTGNHIRIFGQVKEDAPDVIRRKSARPEDPIEEPEGGIRLLYLDLDGKPGCWKVEHEFPMDDAEALEANLKRLLDEAGMGWLGDYDCLFMWSQSAWSSRTLRGHVYWVLDGPVSLVELRQWGKAHNTMKPAYRLDVAVWRLAQPDFVGRRRLEDGLEDIFPDDEARFIPIPGDLMLDEVPIEKLREHMSRDTDNPLYEASKVDTELGPSWKATMAKVGTPHPEGDINGWSYRAAAQMVQELGSRKILRHLQTYAQEMHRLAWIGIATNAGGSRGDESDRNTYDVARFRQYLRSAVDAGMGRNKDTHVDSVFAAVKSASDSGDVEALFCKDTLAHAAIVQDRWPATWQELVSEIKTKLPHVSIVDYRKAVARNRPSSFSLKEPGAFSEGGMDEDAGRRQLMIDILGRFEWIRDVDGEHFAKLQENGKYRLFPMELMCDVFYHMAQQKDPSVPTQFGSACRMYILGGLHLGGTEARGMSGEPMDVQTKNLSASAEGVAEQL